MATETSNYQGNPTFLCVIRKLEWMDSSCQGQGDYKQRFQASSYSQACHAIFPILTAMDGAGDLMK